MGSRKKKPSPTPPDVSVSNEAESRNHRAMAVFMLLVSVILLAGGTGAMSPRNPDVSRQLSITVGALYALAGAGGIVGWTAALRGSRTWSRAIYLMALGVPLGTICAFVGHEIRWGCLAPGVQTPMPGAGRASATFKAGYWAPRIAATLWLVVIVALLAIPSAIAGDWKEAGGILSLAFLGGISFLTTGVAPFSGYRCTVDESGLRVESGSEVQWKDVTGTVYFPIPGYRFIWVRTGGHVQSTAVPLLLKDIEGFVRAVRKFAPADHPLRSRLDRLRPTSS